MEVNMYVYVINTYGFIDRSPSKKEVQTKEGDNDNPNQLKANDRSGAITVKITCQCSWGLLWKKVVLNLYSKTSSYKLCRASLAHSRLS
ncbi:hypothetical protein HanIR_Chr17g0889091 [Helianthus annuus]|nr:hypothetical protein HanIR_Chr17g0889091 [Helianthus annuus]